MTNTAEDNEFRQIIDLLGAATTEAQIAEPMLRATKMLGFEHFSLGTFLVNVEGASRRFTVTSIGDAWLDWYDQNQIMAFDPVLDRASRTLTPFYTDQLDRSALSLKALKFILTAVEYGTAFALCAQAHERGGAFTVCMFGRTFIPTVTGRDEKAAWASWIVTHAHGAMKRVVVSGVLNGASAAHALNENERRCLTSLSRGNTAKQVAAEMDVSTSTVNYYLERAMTKLGAWKPKEAIAKALAANEIATTDMTPRAWRDSDKVVSIAPGLSVKPVSSAPVSASFAAIRTARSFEELFNATNTAVARLGFKSFAFAVRIPSRNGVAHQFVLHSLRDDLAAQAEVPENVQRNPIFGGGPFVALPFFWDDASAIRDNDALLMMRSSVEGMSANDHNPIGLTSMTMGPGGSRGTLMLTSATDRNLDRFECARSANGISKYLHERAVHLALEVAKAPKLDARDTECLRVLSNGHGIKNVATSLECSERQARHHVVKILKKLGVNSHPEAVARAVEWGILPVRRENPQAKQSDTFYKVD